MFFSKFPAISSQCSEVKAGIHLRHRDHSDNFADSGNAESVAMVKVCERATTCPYI